MYQRRSHEVLFSKPTQSGGSIKSSSSTRNGKINYQKFTFTKRPTNPGLHPWFRDNIGLSEFLERRRRPLACTEEQQRAQQKTFVTSANRRRSAKPSGSDVKAWPGFTIHFSLFGAIRSVGRQEKEAFRPDIKPCRVVRQQDKVTAGQRKKAKKPVLKRFVFDFETRKWKQELTVDGSRSITTELVAPSASRPGSCRKAGDGSQLTRSDTRPTNSYATLTSSLQSLGSHDFGSAGGRREDEDEACCFLEAASSTGRDTSLSDDSLRNSSIDRSDGSLQRTRTRCSRHSADVRLDSSQSHQSVDCTSPDCDRRTASCLNGRRPGSVPPLAVLAARIWSEVKANARRHGIASIAGMTGPHPQSVEDINKQTYRIMDAETKEDIGEMRYLSLGGSKISIRKRRVNPEPRREAKVMASDSEDPDNVKDEYPGIRYLYRIVHCRAVTNPEILMSKSHCKQKAVGIIDLFTGHTDAGLMASPRLVCPYCVHEPNQRIRRWLETLGSKHPPRMYTNKDSHCYTRCTRGQHKQQQAATLRTIPET